MPQALSVASHLPDMPATVQVPAGNVAHTRAVELATAAAGLAGALVVLARLWALP
jgi:hypothetical protein